MQFFISMSLALLLLSSPSSLMAAAEQLTLFGGAAGGYTHIDPTQGTSKNGYHLLAQAFLEDRKTDWTWDAGGGFFYNRVYSGGEKNFEGSQPNTVREQRNLRIETRAGTAHAAARYSLELGLEAGLIVRALFGSSLAFSQERSSRSAKFFIGPQAVVQMGTWGGYEQRLDLSLTVSLNVPDKKVYLLNAGYAIGQPLSRAETEEPAPLPMEDRWEEVLADKIINFPTASSQVQGPALGFLTDLGTYLKAHEGSWTGIEVEGHTDIKGKRAYNLRLSQERADAVRTVLVKAGASPARIKARGYGPDKPLIPGETAEALAANRRVVMIFSVQGREQRNALAQEIKSLRQKYFNE